MIVIEHNLEVIKTADFIVDLGPEAVIKEDKGVATGTPEDVAINPESYTGTYLAKYLPEKAQAEEGRLMPRLSKDGAKVGNKQSCYPAPCRLSAQRTVPYVSGCMNKGHAL